MAFWNNALGGLGSGLSTLGSSQTGLSSGGQAAGQQSRGLGQSGLGSILGSIYVSNGVPVGNIVQWQGTSVITSSSSATYTVSIDPAYCAQNGYPGATQWIQYPIPYFNYTAHVYKPSAEDLAREKARAASVAAAASRADQLLLSLLDDEQRDQIKREKFFELKINSRVYRINRGRAGNVQLIEGGKPVAKYCAHPDLWTPDGDAMIAQLMMLKTNEAEFLNIANRTALV